jgi:2-dehydropantoate 2-reductase
VGVIGTIYGWALSSAGHDVIHFVRPGKASKYQDGILMDVLDKRGSRDSQFLGLYLPKTTETLDRNDHYDLVIFPIKHYQLADALKQIAPQLEETTNFLLLTQNWKGTGEIDPLLPKSRYLFGDAKAGGGFREEKLVCTIKAIDLGQIDHRQDECLKVAADLFASTKLRVTLQDNILHYLWVQYAINGGLWPSLVRAGSFEAVLSDRKLGEQGLFAVKECLEVVSRRGVDLNQYPDTKMYLDTSFISRQIAGIALKWMFRHNEYVRRNSVHALSDPQEIKTFYYDLLKTGEELGVPMPVMAGFRQDIDNLSGFKK